MHNEEATCQPISRKLVKNLKNFTFAYKSYIKLNSLIHIKSTYISQRNTLLFKDWFYIIMKSEMNS